MVEVRREKLQTYCDPFAFLDFGKNKGAPDYKKVSPLRYFVYRPISVLAVPILLVRDNPETIGGD